ncbi:hypothetical protein C3L33_02943, partial [Rhododendron williamsianum]
MKPHTPRGFTATAPPANLPPARRRLCLLPELHPRRQVLARRAASQLKRRDVLITPFLAAGAGLLRPAAARADEKPPESPAPPPAAVAPSPAAKAEEKKEEEDGISSRVYDATAIGEPMAVGKDKRKVWEKLMNARVVYLGEAEQVPVRDDKELELEIVKNLRKRCLEVERPLSLALEAFPSNLQEQLNQYVDRRIDGETLKSFASHWPPQRWQEYEPLLSYCRDNGVRLIACGTPLEVIMLSFEAMFRVSGKISVLRTVQAEGIRGLSKADRKIYAPPAGSGFISGFTSMSRRPLSSGGIYNFPDHLTSDGRWRHHRYAVVVTGASHITYGSRGTGLPARISRKTLKKNQVVILLDPERQSIRSEGEVPIADFLWYSAARPCSRNCFDRAEIARVMNAAGRRRDALPQATDDGAWECRKRSIAVTLRERKLLVTMHPNNAKKKKKKCNKAQRTI